MIDEWLPDKPCIRIAAACLGLLRRIIAPLWVESGLFGPHLRLIQIIRSSQPRAQCGALSWAAHPRKPIANHDDIAP